MPPRDPASKEASTRARTHGARPILGCEPPEMLANKPFLFKLLVSGILFFLFIILI